MRRSLIFLIAPLMLAGCAAMQAKNDAVQGTASFAENDFKKSTELLEKATQQDPNNAGHWTLLGWSYFKLGDCNKAISAFEKVGQLDAKALDAYTGRGWSNFKLGDYDQAVSWFDQAAKLDPSASDPYSGLGWSTFRKQDLPKAEEYFNTAARKGMKYVRGSSLRTDPEAHRGLGYLYFSKQDYKTAAGHFQIATVLMPEWNDARVKWADSLYALKDFPSAMHLYEQALRHEKTAELYDKLARCYLQTEGKTSWFGLVEYWGMQELAREMFKKALAIDPTYASALSGLAKLGPEPAPSN